MQSKTSLKSGTISVKKSPTGVASLIQRRVFCSPESSNHDAYRKNWVSQRRGQHFELPPIFRPETAIGKHADLASPQSSSGSSMPSYIPHSGRGQTQQNCASELQGGGLSQISTGKSSVDLTLQKKPVKITSIRADQKAVASKHYFSV